MRGPGGSIANIGRFSPIGCEIDAVIVPCGLAEAPKIPVDIPWLPENELPSVGAAALLAKRGFADQKKIQKEEEGLIRIPLRLSRCKQWRIWLHRSTEKAAKRIPTISQFVAVVVLAGCC
jgi:hypothetical protein